MDNDQINSVENEKEELRFKETQTLADFHQTQKEDLWKKSAYDPCKPFNMSTRDQRIKSVNDPYVPDHSQKASSVRSSTKNLDSVPEKPSLGQVSHQIAPSN